MCRNKQKYVEISWKKEVYMYKICINTGKYKKNLSKYMQKYVENSSIYVENMCKVHIMDYFFFFQKAAQK